MRPREVGCMGWANHEGAAEGRRGDRDGSAMVLASSTPSVERSNISTGGASSGIMSPSSPMSPTSSNVKAKRRSQRNSF